MSSLMRCKGWRMLSREAVERPLQHWSLYGKRSSLPRSWNIICRPTSRSWTLRCHSQNRSLRRFCHEALLVSSASISGFSWLLSSLTVSIIVVYRRRWRFLSSNREGLEVEGSEMFMKLWLRLVTTNSRTKTGIRYSVCRFETNNTNGFQPARLVRKELRKGFGDGDLWAEAGSNEHQIMAYLYHLEHPNILPLLTSYTYNGIPNFILPLAEGGDLEHLLTQNRRPTDFSRNAQFYGAMSGLVSGLQTLHEYKSDVLGREMIGYHHDLKPKNILVSKGRFILSDFGLSKLKTAADSRTPFKMGQGHYLAPECEDPELDFSKGIVSRASDVWSLGCILLEILIFMAEGGDSLIRFRESRSVKQGFLTTRTFFHKRSLNPVVDRRLNEMASSHDDLISKSVALIRQMLIVQLEERLKAGQVTLGFSAISFEACYLTLNAAFRSVKWRVDDTETILEWEKFRHLAGLLITRDDTTTNLDPRIKQSGFLADHSQVESLLDTMNRTINFLDDPNPLNDFATKLTSQLKQLTTLLEPRISEMQCDEASTPAEINSLHHAAHEPINVEQLNKLGWIDSILTVPITNVRNAIISSNEKFLAVEDDRTITIYALPSGDKLQTIRESAEKERSFNFPKFAFAPNGDLLVCWRSHLCSYHV